MLQLAIIDLIRELESRVY